LCGTQAEQHVVVDEAIIAISEVAHLERENAHLKQLVADHALAISLLRKLQSQNRERR